MCNDSLSWIPAALDTQLTGIPGYLWTILGLILALLSIYFGYPYAKKLSRQNKTDLDQAKQDIIEANIETNARSTARLERYINERIQIISQDKPASLFCKEVVEDAKRLQNASSNYDRGLSKATLGDLDGAEAEFNTAIELQLPVLSKYYFQRGNIRYLQEKFKDSCMDYSETIKINPQIAEAWSNKGITLDKLDRLDDAIKAYDKAIEINPQLIEAWFNKGLALKLLGRNAEAEAAFAKAKELGYEG